MPDPKPVVLVADDEPSTLALVAAHVRGKGFQVIEAADGDEAWQRAQEELPDLIVLDVMMPGMSGWEVCRKVRESISLAHTAIVMLTGIGQGLNELTSPLYGADAYIDKPFEFSDLDARIDEALRVHKAGVRPDHSEPAGTRAVGTVRKAQAPSREATDDGPDETASSEIKKKATRAAGKVKAAATKTAKKTKVAVKKSTKKAKAAPKKAKKAKKKVAKKGKATAKKTQAAGKKSAKKAKAAVKKAAKKTRAVVRKAAKKTKAAARKSAKKTKAAAKKPARKTKAGAKKAAKKTKAAARSKARTAKASAKKSARKAKKGKAAAKKGKRAGKK